MAGGMELSQIAELVFIPGLSTAPQVSQISGRGIGMDAVRQFLAESGGRIWLELKEPLDPHGDFYSFVTHIELPLEAKFGPLEAVA